VAYLRRDPLVPEMLGIRRVASQSVLSRFFQGFTSAGRNLGCFRRLFGWCLSACPVGRAAMRWTWTRRGCCTKTAIRRGWPWATRGGTKPCLHPLVAVLSEVRLVAAFWLRPATAVAPTTSWGSSWTCGTTCRPPAAAGGAGRFGLCVSELLRLWEQLRLRFIVVARLIQPVQRLIRRETRWAATEVEGTEVAEVDFREADWPAKTRLILIRHRVQDKRGRAGGKMLFDCPGYLYQALVTIWRGRSNRWRCAGVQWRAACEG